jgi:hypothetical protein
VSPTAGTDADGEACRIGDVVDDVVGPCGVTADSGGDVVQLELVACAPGDVVVCAGGVTADADCAQQGSFGAIEGEAAAEDVDSADAAADHGVVPLAVVGRIAAVGDAGVDGIAFLKAEEATAGLHGAIKISCREGERQQTEGVGGVCFLGGDGAAAGPLD